MRDATSLVRPGNNELYALLFIFYHVDGAFDG